MGKVDSMRDKKTGLVDDLNDLKAYAEAMKPGELTVISGASGVGKTTLALRIAQALAGSDNAVETEASKRVLVFSPKHRSEFFVQKGLCRRRIYIDDYDRLDVTGIDCRTRAMYRVFGVDLLIVDSVQSLREDSGSDTPASVEEVARQLRDFGAELGIPVLLVSERPDATFCADACELAAVSDLANAADVAICLRRNADTGRVSYCMSRKVEPRIPAR